MNKWELDTLNSNIKELLDKNDLPVYIESGAANDRIIGYKLSAEHEAFNTEMILITTGCIFSKEVMIASFTSANIEYYGNLWSLEVMP